METKLKVFLANEISVVKRALKNENDPKHRSDICWNAKQRALGACDLAELYGLSYDKKEKIFWQFCKTMENLEHGYEFGGNENEML